MAYRNNVKMLCLYKTIKTGKESIIHYFFMYF